MVLGLEDLGPVNLHQVMGANEVIVTFLMEVIFTQKSTKVFHKKLIIGCGICYTSLRVCSHYLDSFCASTILDRASFHTWERWFRRDSCNGAKPTSKVKVTCRICSCYSWFTTTWQGGHVGGQNNKIFSRRIYMKKEFSFQGREMLLFLIINMAAATSRANQHSCRHE